MEAEAHDQQVPIRVQGLHKSFGAQTVLDGITLDVKQGETVAVLGRSGTGKSVLLKLLIGLQAPDWRNAEARGHGAGIGARPRNPVAGRAHGGT